VKRGDELMRKTSILASANFLKRDKYNQFSIQIGDIFYKVISKNKTLKYLVIDYEYSFVYVIDVYSNNKFIRKVKTFTYKELEEKGFELEKIY
jgi:hypothetical protein